MLQKELTNATILLRQHICLIVLHLQCEACFMLKPYFQTTAVLWLLSSLSQAAWDMLSWMEQPLPILSADSLAHKQGSLLCIHSVLYAQGQECHACTWPVGMFSSWPGKSLVTDPKKSPRCKIALLRLGRRSLVSAFARMFSKACPQHLRCPLLCSLQLPFVIHLHETVCCHQHLHAEQ